MDRYIMLACRDRELGATIQTRLEEDLSADGNRIMVDLARNAADAKSRLGARKYDLLVTEVELPADRSTPPDPNARMGLALVKDVQPAGIPAVVLATSMGGALLEQIQRLSRCYVVVQGEDHWDESLLRWCREALQPGRAREATAQERRLTKVEIVVNLARPPWTYKLDGPYHATGSLQIDPYAMEQLRDLSDGIGELGEKWERQLHAVGQRLMEQIFKNNPVFAVQFSKLLVMTGREEDVKIEFVVEEAGQGIALESVLEIEQENYWMLRAPVYRKFRAHEAHPFDAANPLHCLIIEADVDGKVDVRGKEVSLSRMANVRAEAEWLQAYLEQNRTRFNIARIEHVKEPSAGQTFLDTLGEVARGATWDIVHYAGHSYYDESHCGYVFLPGKFPETVNVELFSLKLGRPRFVYLSSCQSSQAPFVFTLAEKNAGAILGFRWDIEDLEAVEHAKTFYRALLENGHKLELEYAFLKARQEMHARYKEKKIWAAPILMM